MSMVLVSFNLSYGQWSRSNQTTRLSNNNDKVFIGLVNPIGGGVNRLYLDGDPDNYGNTLVDFRSSVNMSSGETILSLNTFSTSSNNAILLSGSKSANQVFTFYSNGKLNLLSSELTSSRALDVKGQEAIWFDGGYFSWGFGGDWNRFADPITVGGSDQPEEGVGLLITDGNSVRLQGGSGQKRLEFYAGSTEKGSMYHSGNHMVLQNKDPYGSVVLRTDDEDRVWFHHDGRTSLYGDLNMTGGINGISDQKTKRNFQKITNPLQTILALTGYHYDYKRELYPSLQLPSGKQLGLVAQDVEKLIPEAVSSIESAEGETLKTVNYTSIIPVLVEAIKEQQELIKDLQKEVNRLRESSGNGGVID